MVNNLVVSIVYIYIYKIMHCNIDWLRTTLYEPKTGIKPLTVAQKIAVQWERPKIELAKMALKIAKKVGFS